MERQEIDSGPSAAAAGAADAPPAAVAAAPPPATAAPRFQKIFSYRECLKNHNVDKGPSSVDGCGQFLAQPDDPLKCSVCTCHRNFHRQETRYSDGSELCADRVAEEAAAVITDYLSKEKKSGDIAFALLEEIVRLLALVKQVPKAEKIDLEMIPASGQQSPPSPVAEGPPGLTNDEGMEVTPTAASLSDQAPGSREKSGKRKRTKFTEQQKVMLEALAEKANWALANLSKEEQEKGAADIGIKLDSLRYWFHNTKQKKQKKT